MFHGQKWETIEKLGEGGQGVVWLAQEKKAHKSLRDALTLQPRLTRPRDDARDMEEFKRYRNAMKDLLAPSSDSLAALKVLHKRDEARDPERARERIQREMNTMSAVSHPNLLQIKEVDPPGGWFAAEYHRNGSLSKSPNRFKGDFLSALTAFRPLVAGVAQLHSQGTVHRDIKPENVFISLEGQLVLGDFGLVFFTADDRTRLSATLENVGSRDWMPPWAMGVRIEEIKATFDVFSLGKVLWSMVSGDPFLLLWYFQRSKYNLEERFPDNPSARLFNQLLAKCVVEEEEDCLPDAGALLAEIDEVLPIVQGHGELLGEEIKRRCRVCAVGEYEVFPEGEIDNSPLRKPAGQRGLKMFTCNHCGHVQLFLFPDKNAQLPAWRSEGN
jgi:serine/threonine protein kinase